MYQHITEPTRYREGNRPTLDDLLFSSYANNISELMYEAPLGNSDHVSITCCLNTDLKPGSFKKATNNYNKADYSKMKTMLAKDWDTLLNNKTVQEVSDIIQEAYNSAVEDCIPKYKQQKSDSKPIWMTGSAYRKMKRKYSSWIRYLNTKQSQTYKEYIAKRN